MSKHALSPWLQKKCPLIGYFLFFFLVDFLFLVDHATTPTNAISPRTIQSAARPVVAPWTG